jgi:hypothetical protein
MSVDCFLFLRDKRLPSIQQWQKSLDELNVGIVLDHVEDLREHTGYLPAKFKGKDCGFEWFYSPAEEAFGDLPEDVGDRTFAANFVLHSDMRELVCAMYALAALAKVADGLFFDEESESFVTGDRALVIARNIESQELRDK